MFGNRDAAMVGEVQKTIQQSVESSVRRALAEESNLHSQLRSARDDLKKVREDVEKAKIERDRQTEKHDREKRDIEHMVGLEKRRQELEAELNKREVTVSVREENLTADRERFEEQMRFMKSRMETELESLKELTKEILTRLPTVTVDKTIEVDGHRPRARARAE